VGVDLGGVQVAVAKQLLDVADAGASTQEMRRARVAEGVDRRSEFRLQSIVADAVCDHWIRETAAGDGEPQGRGWRNKFRLATSSAFAPPLARGQLRTRGREVTREPVSRAFGERHQSIALAFAQAHSQTVSGGIDVIEIESMRFNMTNAGGIESFHQGAITDAKCGPWVRSFDETSDV
jgi:hypothetical protein